VKVHFLFLTEVLTEVLWSRISIISFSCARSISANHQLFKPYCVLWNGHLGLRVTILKEY